MFHSFQDFNVQHFESATFSGPNQIQNVISRVTGGNPSHLDGLIRSSIGNADMYFLNPYGIMFGPNARLDVQGSFHVSTADYLRLGENGRFDARNPSDSLLTIAPIESFGFLTQSPAKITTQSSKLVVPTNKALSLIGGDIHLTSDISLTADNSLYIPTVESESILAASYGRVNLASLASAGEVIPTENDLMLQGNGGQIMVENTLIEMSGYGGGAVFIRAGLFFLDNAIIRSNTFGHQDGKSINLRLTESAYFNGLNTEISVMTASPSHAGGLLIEVPYLEMTGALMNTGSVQAGQAGNIKIHAKEAILKDGALIASASLDTGQSGDIQLEVEDNLSIIGYLPGYRINHGIEMENAKSIIFSISSSIGQSGNISINTNNLNMKSGSISTDSYGTAPGGNITIHAEQANLIDGTTISNSIFNQGTAGYLSMNITEQLFLAGQLPFDTGFGFGKIVKTWGEKSPTTITSSTDSSSTGGVIDIQANHIIVADKAAILANSTASGDAGDIFIQANNLQIINNGQINTSTKHAVGGNISLTIPKLLNLQNGEITTSVHGGSGDGGNITIFHPRFTLLNKGQIKAQANAGNGGNIRIAAERLIKSYESVVSASSKFGLDGHVEIDSPNENVTEGMLTLSSETVDAGRMMEKPCEAMTYQEHQNRAHFVVHPLAGNPASPYDLQPSPPLKTTTTKQPQQTSQKAITHQPHSMIVATCKNLHRLKLKP